MEYDYFKILTRNPEAFGGSCPLCKTPLVAGVKHECSNGKPIIDVKGSGSAVSPPDARSRQLAKGE